MSKRYTVTLNDGRVVSPPDKVITEWRKEYTAVPTRGFFSLTVMDGNVPVGFVSPLNLAKFLSQRDPSNNG